MPRVARLTTYPVKALSPQDCDRVTVSGAGTLAGDREWMLVGPDGDPVNGKRTARVHDLRTAVDDGTLTVEADGGETRAFDLPADQTAAESWFSSVFDRQVSLRRDPDGRPDRGGTVSVVSTATLEAAADWFEAVTVENLRRRLRANVEVAGVEPFWEDRFVGADAPDFVVGDPDDDGSVRFAGVEHCVRCVVPTRDPDTGEGTPGFRERFVERRKGTYPEWVDTDEIPTDYTLMLIASVHEADHGGTLAVGQPVSVVG